MIVYQYNIKRFFYVSLDYKFFSNYKFTKNQREFSLYLHVIWVSGMFGSNNKLNSKVVFIVLIIQRRPVYVKMCFFIANSAKAFKVTVVNRCCNLLHRGSLKNTLTIPWKFVEYNPFKVCRIQPLYPLKFVEYNPFKVCRIQPLKVCRIQSL